MKKTVYTVLGTALVSVGVGTYADPAPEAGVAAAFATVHGQDPVTQDPVVGTEVVKEYCLRCHGGGRRIQAGLNLAEFDLSAAGQNAETAEKMIRKLRARLMPPAGEPRPDITTYAAFARKRGSTRRLARIRRILSLWT